MGNGAFQNAPFANIPFANGSFPNGGYSCLWAMYVKPIPLKSKINPKIRILHVRDHGGIANFTHDMTGTFLHKTGLLICKVSSSEIACPQATVTTVWKTPVCKRGVCIRGILKCSVSYVLNFRGWIKLIYDKITIIYCVKNEFNQTSEVQNIGNGAFQNALFANGDCSCL